MAKIYIGFASSQHDPAVAIVDSSGEVLFAEANVRSLKNKRGWNAVPDPVGVIEPLLKKYGRNKQIVAGLTWSDQGLKWSPLVSLLLSLKRQYNQRFLGERERTGAQHTLHGLQQAMYKAPSATSQLLANLEYRLHETGVAAPLQKVGYNHHLCHAATACFTSDFPEALCLVVDGMGESGSVSLYDYRNREISLLERSSSLNLASLGAWYGAVCWACGFDPIKGEEWKVMGLAAYGRRDESLYALLRPMLKIEGCHLKQASDYNQRLTKLCQLRGSFHQPADAANLASTAQLVFEEVMLDLIRAVHAKYGGGNLILSGGCALNSSCNGKILTHTPFKNLHIPMAPGDDGNALGAAFLAWQQEHPGQSPKPAASPYLGSEIDSGDLLRFVKFGRMTADHYDSETALAGRISDELARGKLVGWVQGRAEFGPRSLGNRSILADPRHPQVKDKINATVKFREEFRPFAPSILHEYGSAYFADYSYSPYMERTLVFKDKRSAPGVVHHDGTGRVQSVTQQSNSRYHALLSAFHRRTGVPLLLNTSFNVMGRPIIHDAEDAFGVYFGSGLDLLVIGNHVFNGKGA